ncbi:hypothetical protein BGAL_0070g00100 [Botrytis galanthina]|uniref:Uncharacterized protein n=1 Tax=Botrytis galanthina TaxID=278940 RepID=A0A4S8RE26_9HELO|nr:hypothetical protein BGAL_0070g00100 [Botrytis galanthina]
MPIVAAPNMNDIDRAKVFLVDFVSLQNGSRNSGQENLKEIVADGEASTLPPTLDSSFTLPFTIPR